MEVLEAIYSRRSVRKFTAEPIPDTLLSRLVEAALQAPSGGNIQPWAFLVIREPPRLRQLRALAPGIIGKPTAVVTICLDRRRATTSIEPVLLVALGYPARLPSSPGRRDLKGVCFFERWGVTEDA